MSNRVERILAAGLVVAGVWVGMSGDISAMNNSKDILVRTKVYYDRENPNSNSKYEGLLNKAVNFVKYGETKKREMKPNEVQDEKVDIDDIITLESGAKVFFLNEALEKKGLSQKIKEQLDDKDFVCMAKLKLTQFCLMLDYNLKLLCHHLIYFLTLLINYRLHK